MPCCLGPAAWHRLFIPSIAYVVGFMVSTLVSYPLHRVGSWDFLSICLPACRVACLPRQITWVRPFVNYVWICLRWFCGFTSIFNSLLVL
jgi:hypothetical protein